MNGKGVGDGKERGGGGGGGGYRVFGNPFRRLGWFDLVVG